jgi:hypothetical protein
VGPTRRIIVSKSNEISAFRVEITADAGAGLVIARIEAPVEGAIFPSPRPTDLKARMSEFIL